MGPLPPALPSSPPRAEAALVAPAPPPPPERARPRTFALRAGAGVGLGDGFGGTFFGQFDAFPISWLGVGFEGELTGMQAIPIFPPADSASFQAARGRVGLRWIVQSQRSVVALGAAFGVGPSAIHYTHYVSVPCDFSVESCDDGVFGGDDVPETTSRSALSTSFELSLRVTWRTLELGAFARYVTFDDLGLFTLGPTLGAAF